MARGSDMSGRYDRDARPDVVMGSWQRLTLRSMAGIGVGIDLLRLAGGAFMRHRARRLGAGLAYYSLFALVPTLFLAVAIVAAVFGEEATEGRLVDRLDDVVGPEVAEQIDAAVGAVWENSNTSGFAIVTAAVVVYSASILFVAWRDTLDAIWELPYRTGLNTSIRRRIYGAMGPIAAGVLLAAIVLIEILTALAADLITSPVLDAIIQATQTISPTVVSVFALALVYRVSTRFRPRWKDIWPGTLLAALALGVLAWGYGLYVRHYGSSSVAGVAGTVLLGLAFIYYSAQTLLFGAEVISTCADHRGHPIHPATDEADAADDS
jgi:membrane protein